MTKCVVGQAVAFEELGSFEFVVVFGAGVLAFDGVYEEARDDLTVVGEVANVLLEITLDAHRLSSVCQFL